MQRRNRRPLPPGFGAVWTTVAIDLVGFGIVLPILPLYARRFGATSLEATALVATFSAASFVFSPVWGRASDRIGRKPVLVASLVGTAVASLITGLAGGLVVLFAARIIDGVSGASVSVAQAWVADLAEPEERPRLFGLLGAAFGVGFVVGPAIGALGAVVDPRLPFFLAAAIAGLNAVVALRRLPAGGQPGHGALAASRHPGPRSHEHQDAGVTPPPATATPVAAPLVASQAVTTPAVEIGAVAGRGAGTVSLLLKGDVVGLIGVAFLALIAFSGFEATFALFGHRHLGLSLGSSAGVFAAVGAAIVIVQGGLVRPVVHRLGQSVTLKLGLALDAFGLVLLGLAGGWALAVPALVALTVGQGLVQTTMTSTLAARADPLRRGEMLGAQQSAAGLARVIGPMLGGALLGSHDSGAPFLVGALLTAGALMLLTLGRAPAYRAVT